MLIPRIIFCILPKIIKNNVYAHHDRENQYQYDDDRSFFPCHNVIIYVITDGVICQAVEKIEGDQERVVAASIS